MNHEEAFSNLQQIICDYPESINLSETDTRCKIIDKILVNVLGWNEQNISREHHTDAGFSDYILSIDGAKHLIIEAKKESDSFYLPITNSNRNYKINGTISSVDNLSSAIIQARNYADENGIRYAMISNGRQFGIFIAITIGSSWKEGQIIFFHSLLDIQKNFSYFWNLLSIDNVKNGSLHQMLEKKVPDIPFYKIIDEMREQNSTYTRNHLYTYLFPLTKLIFSELLDEKQTEILKRCYVYGRSDNSLYKDFEESFIDKPPRNIRDMNVKEIIENPKKAGVFQDEFIKLSRLKKSNIILLLGGIGAGKSTFLHRFFKIVLENNPNIIYFSIDFRSSSADEKNLEVYILNKICEIWKTTYLSVCHKFLLENGFSSDLCNDKNHIKQIFSILSTYKQITLIIDNVDQHTRSYQEALFLEAYHLADYFQITTIVALREETFLNSSRTGTFDAYDIPKFHIASPNFLSMIKIRIKYAIDFLEHIETNEVNDIKLPKNIRIELCKYFSIILSSLDKSNKQSRKIISLIDSITVGNMREGLEYFNELISK